MEEKTYKVKKIEGEYAYLADFYASSDEELFIAMALLPDGVDVGDVLEFKNFEFTLISQYDIQNLQLKATSYVCDNYTKFTINYIL